MFVSVKLLVCAVPVTVRLTVRLEAVTEKLFTTNSLAPEPESRVASAPPVPALNRQPLGAVKMSVLLVWPENPPFPPLGVMWFPSVETAGGARFGFLDPGGPAPPLAAV